MWNGADLWVGPPKRVSELPGTAEDTGKTFYAATLQCTPELRVDWDTFGTIHIFHEGIVPLGRYSITTIDDCKLCHPGFPPDVPVEFPTARWGDIGQLEGGAFIAPDDSLDVGDILGILEKFAGRSTAPIKARADLVPSIPDHLITVSDIVAVLNAFSGLPYPFSPSAASPCE